MICATVARSIVRRRWKLIIEASDAVLGVSFLVTARAQLAFRFARGGRSGGVGLEACVGFLRGGVENSFIVAAIIEGCGQQ